VADVNNVRFTFKEMVSYIRDEEEGISRIDSYFAPEEGEDEWEPAPVIPEEPAVFLGYEINPVLFAVCVGLLVYGIACQLAIVWFTNEKLAFCLGLWAGVATAYVYLIHMWHSISRYLIMGAFASRMARKGTFFRYLIAAIVLGLAAFFSITALLGVIIGLTGMKISILLQPIIRKARTLPTERRKT
jgi:uncharacterized membrane-anchored protein